MRKLEIRFYKGQQYYRIKDFNQIELYIQNDNAQGVRVTDEQIYEALDKLFKELLNKQLEQKEEK